MFVNFDIMEFYPSISPTLLEKAISWAQKLIVIREDEIEAISNPRKLLLFSNGKTWRKRTNGSLFDVTMGSFDGAEVCELVGLFVLAQLPKKYQNGSVGLYLDDGLGVLQDLFVSQADGARKEITALFKSLRL